MEESEPQASQEQNHGDTLEQLKPLVSNPQEEKKKSVVDEDDVEDLFGPVEDEEEAEDNNQDNIEVHDDDDEEVQVLNSKSTSFQIQFANSTKIEEDEEKEDN